MSNRIEQFAASQGYSITSIKNPKEGKRSVVMSKGGRSVTIDDQLMDDIIADHERPVNSAMKVA